MAKDNTKGKEEIRVNRHTRKNNIKVDLWGAIEELGIDVHCHGDKRQATFCNKTSEAIADCVSGEHNKDMRDSVNDGVEVNLTEPREPKGNVTTHK